MSLAEIFSAMGRRGAQYTEVIELTNEFQGYYILDLNANKDYLDFRFEGQIMRDRRSVII